MRAFDERGVVGLGVAALLAFGCAGEDSGPALLAAFGGGPCPTTYLEGVEDAFDLAVDLSVPGSSPAIVFDMAIPGSPGDMILLTREITIEAPAAFGFNGFGAPGAAVGQWDFDFSNPDGVYEPPADYTIPHRALSANQAYADTRLNGSYDAGVDSVATHSLGTGGVHLFQVVMPSGGTNNNGAGGNCSYFDTDVRFTLPAGVVVLPGAPGSYDVRITAVSVDPDTGDDDDGQGTAPRVYQRTVPISVPAPAAGAGGRAAFAALAWRRRAATASRA
jgi:hypothetical protein